MDWTNERWVKLYTRDTVAWGLLCWQARCLLPLLMRRCDAAGVIDFPARVGATRAIAKFLDVPEDLVGAALDDLESSETIELRDSSLLIVNFVDAQDAKASTAERQRRLRERSKRIVANAGVTHGHAKSRDVTTREIREIRKTTTTRARTRSKPCAETVADSPDDLSAIKAEEEREVSREPRQLPVIPIGTAKQTAGHGHLLELDYVRREVEAATDRRIGPLSRRVEHTLPGLQAALAELEDFQRVKDFVRWTAQETAAGRIPEVHWRHMFKGDGLGVRLEEWRKATEGAKVRQKRQREAAEEVAELAKREAEEERVDGAAVLDRLAQETGAAFLRRGGGGQS